MGNTYNVWKIPLTSKIQRFISKIQVVKDDSKLVNGYFYEAPRNSWYFLQNLFLHSNATFKAILRHQTLGDKSLPVLVIYNFLLHRKTVHLTVTLLDIMRVAMLRIQGSSLQPIYVWHRSCHFWYKINHWDVLLQSL